MAGEEGGREEEQTCHMQQPLPRDTVTDTHCCFHLDRLFQAPHPLGVNHGPSRLAVHWVGVHPTSTSGSAEQAGGTKRFPVRTHGGGGSRHEPNGNTCSAARSDVLQLPPVTDFPLPLSLPRPSEEQPHPPSHLPFSPQPPGQQLQHPGPNLATPWGARRASLRRRLPRP